MLTPKPWVAVWGVESNYRHSFGKRPLVTSLATLSCFRPPAKLLSRRSSSPR